MVKFSSCHKSKNFSWENGGIFSYFLPVLTHKLLATLSLFTCLWGWNDNWTTSSCCWGLNERCYTSGSQVVRSQQALVMKIMMSIMLCSFPQQSSLIKYLKFLLFVVVVLLQYALKWNCFHKNQQVASSITVNSERKGLGKVKYSELSTVMKNRIIRSSFPLHYGDVISWIGWTM